MTARSTRPSQSVFHASRSQLRRLLELDDDSSETWNPDELPTVYQHQLTAPLSADLDAAVLQEHATTGIASFEDLLFHASPPIDLLELVENFALTQETDSASCMSDGIAQVLRTASILAARSHAHARIGGLSDTELRQRVQWAMNLEWIDDRTRSLLREASARLDAP